MQSILKKGYKFRIYPTPEQVVFLEKTFGCCRKTWNTLLAQAIEEYTSWKLDTTLPKPKISSYDFAKAITLMKTQEEYRYLNEVPSKALALTGHALGQSFQRFFQSKGKLGYPKFKRKNTNKSSFTLESYPTGAEYFWVKNKVFTITKLKTPIKISWSRDLPSSPTQVTISKNAAGQYFASFLCDVLPKFTNGQGVIGVDIGIKTLATVSNGTAIRNPKYFIIAQKKLAKYQRRFARKCKGSKNREKARLKVAKCHLKIINQRNEYLHQLTRKLVNDNKVIVIEDLAVKNLSKNSKLSKHIMDAGLSKFRRYLEYKAIESLWCRVLVADRFYPSTQLCSYCGIKPLVKIKLGVSKWTCVSCGTIHGRDDNASINLSHLAIKHPELWMEYPGKVIICKSYRELIGF